MAGLALIFGFLAASAALLVQVFVSLFFTVPASGTFSFALLVGAASIEEGAKFAFLVQLGRRVGTLPLSLALLFGIGFVGAEFALLTLSITDRPSLTSLAAIAGIHIVGTLLIYSGLRFRPYFPSGPLATLLLAILVHVLYNTSL